MAPDDAAAWDPHGSCDEADADGGQQATVGHLVPHEAGALLRAPTVSTPTSRRRRVFCVGSAGGHLAQLRVLFPWLEQQCTTWVTFDLPDARSVLAGEDVVWAHSPTTRSLKNLVRNFGHAWRLVRSRRPDLIVSTGAGVALPYFVIGRWYGARTSYIEVVDRIDSKTLSGRLCRPFTSLFLVQTAGQQELYPEAVLIGCLL